MQLEARGGGTVSAVDRAEPRPGAGQLLIRVLACGVCRTDLHVVDGDLGEPTLPIVPGHEIVGEVVALGEGAGGFAIGERVGVPWLGSSCGSCRFCASARENLCDDAVYTGYQRDGGYAEFTVADAAYCLALPEGFSDVHAAPLLCAGLIGHRAYRMAGGGECLGIYGFGAAAHILAQVAVHEGRRVHAFTRPGDVESQAFARRLGAVWAGGSDQAPPEPLDAAILFAPVGALVPEALRHSQKGAVVVCAGIHMSQIPAFAYELIWGERTLCSVANLTRRDAREFLEVAARVPVRTEVSRYPLRDANRALDDLRNGRLVGAAVLVPG